MEIAILAVLAVVGLFYLRWFLFPLPHRGPAENARYDTVDLVFGGVLAALLLWNAWDAMGKKMVISVPVLVASCFLYGCLIILIVGVLVYRRLNPVVLFGLKWPDWSRQLPLAILALLCFYPALLLVQMGIMQLCGPSDSAQDIVTFLTTSKTWKERAAVAAMAIVFAPISEEVLFRGYLYGIMRQYLGIWPGLIGSAFIFAMIHAHLPSAPGLFLLAALLTLVYQKTGSLWANISLHACFNAATIIVTLYYPKLLS